MKSESLDRLGSQKMTKYRNIYRNSIRWNGAKSLFEKTVIVYCEQGMGDIIQFARYIPFLKKKNCKIILHCPKELHKLLQTIEGVDKVFDRDDENLPPHDYHILSMSLPFVLNNPKTDFPYIHVDEKASLEEVDERLVRVGIAWEGNPDHSNNDTRCCPLKYFRPIHDLPNVQLFMLQSGVHTPTLVDDCGDDFNLFGAELNDFYDTATLINAMDIVVCVDTSVLHLAGALNKTTFGLLSKISDYRWNIPGWYKSVTLLRQRREGDWENLLIDRRLIDYIKKYALNQDLLSELRNKS